MGNKVDSSSYLAIEGGLGVMHLYFLGVGFVVVVRLMLMRIFIELDGGKFGCGFGGEKILFIFETKGKSKSILCSFTHYYYR